MDLSISQMMHMQKELFEPHKDVWHPIEPEYGRDFILYMIEEIGEVIAILKKKGNGRSWRTRRSEPLFWKKWRMC